MMSKSLADARHAALADVRHAALAGRRHEQVSLRRAASTAPMRKILLTLDGSPAGESALPYAHAVGRAFGAELTLLRILEAPPCTGTTPPIEALEWEATRGRARSYLEAIAPRLAIDGVLPKLRIAEGRPAEQILRHIGEYDTDLVVLSSHGEGGRSSWSLSQTAHLVMSSVQTSVLLVPANGTPESVKFRRILVPHDCSMRSTVVLPVAAQLGRHHEAELVLGYVVTEPEIPNPAPLSGADRDLVNRLVQRSESEARVHLERTAEQLLDQGVRCDIAIRRGRNPAEAICALADATDSDLVLLGAHGAGSGSALYGSVTEQVIQHGRRPLLIVRDLATAQDASVLAVPGEPIPPDR